MKSRPQRNLSAFIKSQLVKKSGLSLFLQITGKLSGYLFILLVTQLYGAATWGLFALGLAVLRISSMISKTGLDNFLTRFIPIYTRNNDLYRIRDIYTKGLFITCSFSLPIALLLFFMSEQLATTIFNKPELGFPLKLFSYCVPLFSITLLNSGLLRGFKHTKEFNFLRDASLFLIATILLGLFYTISSTSSSNTPFYIFLISCIATTLISFILIQQKTNLFSYPKGHGKSIKEILAISFPMMLTTSMMFIMGWTDTLMLGAFVPSEEVGIYNISVKIVSVTLLAINSVNSIAAPTFSEYFEQEPNELNKYIAKANRLIFFLTLPTILIITIFPEFILTIFGNDFDAGIPVIYILLTGTVFSVCSGSVGYIMQMIGEEKTFRNIIILTAFLNIILNFTGIKLFGMTGAALATAISMITWNLSSALFLKNKYNIKSYISFKRLINPNE